MSFADLELVVFPNGVIKLKSLLSESGRVSSGVYDISAIFVSIGENGDPQVSPFLSFCNGWFTGT